MRYGFVILTEDNEQVHTISEYNYKTYDEARKALGQELKVLLEADEYYGDTMITVLKIKGRA